MSPVSKRKRNEVGREDISTPAAQLAKESQRPPSPPSTGAECPFTIEYPTSAQSRKAKRRKGVGGSADDEDLVAPKLEHVEDLKGLDITYTIRPRTLWEDTKKYRNFVVGDETFRINDFIYINHSNIAHGATLKNTDERQFWVARVLEVRAKDQQHVYLRVFWAYWPDELPGGAQEYHGKHELVVSNHMEIIDAMTVAGKAPVVHWKESDEKEDLEGLYWRQTFNVSTNRLSHVRKHCICHQPYNPDHTLIGCTNALCKIWLHDECVIRDALQKTYNRKKDDGLDSQEKEPEIEKPTTNGKGRRKQRGKTKKDPQSKDPWDGLFSAEIELKRLKEEDANSEAETDGDGDSEEQPAWIVITDHRDKDKEPSVWKESIICLACKNAIK
ncbi:hypothetical protein L228DRAFT_2173 [Xylona heveae TC161]|uniref:BAH domain-containing protein n=1 Tax=Xylona heveae (strain CBS 132557 / TC161) TaxID=1328760 RepID=A0A165JAG2_XYLHT|nr:hypothetical protein L228DRAFT_2173 [Xylona heveae TC161]KZF25970.1 hypothetical protein L228DRAFT_2173 [Xylona heveae TC161]